jgi:hypothetical protein
MSNDDLFEKAGGLFKKIGNTLKQTSKQVTGIGRGSVRLELDRTRVAPGDTLRGRVVLDLPEPVDAKRLVVTLAAHQRTVSFERLGAHRGLSLRSRARRCARVRARLDELRAGRPARCARQAGACRQPSDRRRAALGRVGALAERGSDRVERGRAARGGVGPRSHGVRRYRDRALSLRAG